MYPRRGPDDEQPACGDGRVKLSEGCYALVGRCEECRPFLWLGEAAARHVAGGIGGEVVIVDQDGDGPFGPVSGVAGG
jgi:hypothetical protein